MFENKIIAITGGTDGIGRALVEAFLKKGAKVSTCSRTPEKLDHLKTEFSGIPLFTLVADVSKEEDCKNFIEKTIQEFGGIDVLINNAGVRQDTLLMSMTDEQWDTVLDTSLQGMYNVTKAVLNPMLMNRYGRIVNMVSLSGIKGLPGQVNYSAAKGGMIGATKALAQEIAKRNITVNAVAPGFIKTDMTEELNEKELSNMIPMKRFGSAEEVADLVGFLVSKESSYITGQVISINGGLYT